MELIDRTHIQSSDDEQRQRGLETSTISISVCPTTTKNLSKIGCMISFLLVRQLSILARKHLSKFDFMFSFLLQSQLEILAIYFKEIICRILFVCSRFCCRVS